MKILITGQKGIAGAIASAYSDHDVTMVSRGTGHDINNIDKWGNSFIDYNCVFNCAYDGMGQIAVLDYFFKHWQNDPDKKIISIGSRVISHRLTKQSGYWEYRLHKQALQEAHDTMLLSAKCDLKIINPGPVDTDMVLHLSEPKMSVQELASRVKYIVNDTTIKRLDLWL
jgi:hypothetical protein